MRRLMLFLATLGFAVLAGTAHAADDSGTIEVGGIVRSYRLYVPPGPAPVGGFPVILAFHGGGGRARGMERLTHLDRIAARRRFIAVYSNGVDRHWNDGRSTIKHPVDDVGFVRALLDRLERNLPVDKARVFATGISNGALFSERLGCELSGRIAAIAPVAGSMPADLAPRCHPHEPVAVMQIDGTADPIMPHDGGKVADFGGRGEGGRVIGAGRTAAFWAKANGCGDAGTELTLEPTALFDRTRVKLMRYRDCPADGKVRVVTVLGGGHAWPGGPQYLPAFIIGKASRQIDASAMIADFFLSLPPR